MLNYFFVLLQTLNKHAQLPLKNAAGQSKLRAFLCIRSAQCRTKTRSILSSPGVGRSMLYQAQIFLSHE